MNTRSTKRLVREGEFVAEVEVSLVETEGGWTPYLSLESASASRRDSHTNRNTRSAATPSMTADAITAPRRNVERLSPT